MTQTTQGTGPGAVERVIPRIINRVRVENIETRKIVQSVADQIDLSKLVPVKIDGGVLSALGILNISEEEANIILKAAEIIKRKSQ
jgi:hypothetical protein